MGMESILKLGTGDRKEWELTAWEWEVGLIEVHVKIHSRPSLLNSVCKTQLYVCSSALNYA